MTAHAPREGGRSLVLASILALVGLAVLIGLGTWQLERKAWKEGVIATLSDRLSAAPVPLPARENWPKLDPKRDEFRRVAFAAEFLHDKEVLVYTAGSSLRPDVSGAGYWVFTPARLLGGSIVLIDRGFIPEARKDPGARREGQVSGVIDIVGALRWPEPRGLFTPADSPGANLWFTRDPESVAQAKGLGPVAPFYVAMEQPAPPGGLPKPGVLHPNLPNNHLQYALTWFGLALTLVGVFGAWVMRRGGS